MDRQWDIFPRLLYKPEVSPSLSRTCSWDIQGLRMDCVGPLGPTAHTPLSRACKSVPVNRMGKRLDGHVWPACVSLPRVCLSQLLLGVKKGVQLPLLVNKSLKRWWGGVASSHLGVGALPAVSQPYLKDEGEG